MNSENLSKHMHPSCDCMFDSLDVDKSGNINFDEFLEAYKGYNDGEYITKEQI